MGLTNSRCSAILVAMTIKSGIHRVRSWLRTPGINRRRVAEATRLNWHAVNNALSGDPKLSTLLAIEEVIPPEFEPPDPEADSPTCSGNAEEARDAHPDQGEAA